MNLQVGSLQPVAGPVHKVTYYTGDPKEPQYVAFRN